MAIHQDIQILRDRFYQSAANIHQVSGLPIQWGDNAGNHMDFSIANFCGHINWYFRDAEINHYGGNVCVVFKNYNARSIPAGFHQHPNPEHPDWIISSQHSNNVRGSITWVFEQINVVVNR